MIRRRSFFTATLAVAAIPVIPSIVRAAPMPSCVFELVDDIASISKALDAIDPRERLADWETVADAQSLLIDALTAETPATVAELSAKIDTLLPFYHDDAEGILIGTVADDARALAEGTR